MEYQYINIQLYKNNNIFIYLNDILIFIIDNKYKIEDCFLIDNKSFILNDNIYLFNFNDYYNFYKINYQNDIIINCVDTICFIDIFKFKDYIDYFSINNDSILCPNIINNNVCDYIQQKYYNLIPIDKIITQNKKSVNDVNFKTSSYNAKILHENFLNNIENFINKSFNNYNFPLYYIDPVFYTSLGKNLDENFLGKKKYILSSFFVSNLYYDDQILNFDFEILNHYNDIYNKYYDIL